MEVDKREYDGLLSENALLKATLRNLLEAYAGDASRESVPHFEQALDSARQVLAVHG